jgi:hypothetical protein
MAEQEPSEQQQQRQQQQLSVLPVPAVADHIEASTLLPALQQLLSVYKVRNRANSTSTSAVKSAQLLLQRSSGLRCAGVPAATALTLQYTMCRLSTGRC